MRPPQNDPYWDAFINRPPADPNNLIPTAFRGLREGDPNPVQGTVHSPNVMAGHIKELGRFYGADLVGIVEVPAPPGFAIISVFKADYDTRTARGIGGQTPLLKGLFETFTLAAYIRELGFVATRANLAEGNRGERLAAAAGLGTLDDHGRLLLSLSLWERAGVRASQRHAHVAEVIFTDLPLQPDGREPAA